MNVWLLKSQMKQNGKSGQFNVYLGLLRICMYHFGKVGIANEVPRNKGPWKFFVIKNKQNDQMLALENHGIVYNSNESLLNEWKRSMMVLSGDNTAAGWLMQETKNR